MISLCRCGESYLSGRANKLSPRSEDSGPRLAYQRFTGRHPALQQPNNAFQSAKMGLTGVSGKHIRTSIAGKICCNASYGYIHQECKPAETNSSSTLDKGDTSLRYAL